MSTRCLRSAAPSSSVSELSQPQQQYLVFLAPSKGLAWGQRERNPTGGGMVLCRRSALKRLRAGAREGLAAVGKDVTIWHFLPLQKWVAWVKWSDCFGPWRHLVRPEAVEKGRWDGEGEVGCAEWLGLEARGGEGEEKGRGEQSSKRPRVSAGCYGLEELHLRAFARPAVRGMARQVHSFEGAHWTWWSARCLSLHAGSSQNPWYILQPRGQEGEGCPGRTSHFQLWARKGEQIEDRGGKAEQIFCCRLLTLTRGAARCLCTSLDFAKPTDL